MVGRHRGDLPFPTIRCLLDHLGAIRSHSFIEVLSVEIGNRLVAKRIRYRNLQSLLESGPLGKLVVPCLDVGELVDVDPAPFSRVGEDENRDINNCQMVSSYKERC